MQPGAICLKMAATSATTHAIGELVSQAIGGDIKDGGRVLRFALVGLLLHGPLSYVWLTSAERSTRRLRSRWPHALVTMCLVVSDQLFWGPFWCVYEAATVRLAS